MKLVKESGGSEVGSIEIEEQIIDQVENLFNKSKNERTTRKDNTNMKLVEYRRIRRRSNIQVRGNMKVDDKDPGGRKNGIRT